MSGCLYLQEKNILHLDLRCANILVHNDIPKIADFGFAEDVGSKGFAKSGGGDHHYMSPETLEKQHFDEKSQVFGLGIVLY